MTLETTDGGLRLRVEDDGVGFATDMSSGHRGLGLLSMEERVRPLRGSFTLNSALGKGTRVEVWVPMRDSTTANTNHSTAKK